jgi:RNA polymerase sigma-70 factor, ECF subfamily
LSKPGMNRALLKTSDPVEEDTLLVKASIHGDRTAFDRLVLKHKDRVFGLCYWLLGDYQEADEAAQEIFVRAFRSLGKFRFESAFTTWLFRIGVNFCRNRNGSREYREKRKTVSLDRNPSEQGLALQVEDESPSPDARMEERERNRIIRGAVETLPEDQKTVVTLRDIEGLGYEEIARITGLNLGTVKSRISRARLTLKEKLRSLL